MKRALLAVTLMLAVNAHAQRWSDAYKRGLAAVKSRNYHGVVDGMQQAIAEMPNETLNGPHDRNATLIYVPHYWLGVAKLNLDDLDGALRELKISEDQGVIQNTEYYSNLRNLVALANERKVRAAHPDVADARKAADAAVSAAMSTQTDAIGVGADRSEMYRTGFRMMKQAMDDRRSASDAKDLYRVADEANHARDAFAAAADEARRAKAARPAPVIVAKQPPPRPAAQAPVAPVDINHIEVQTTPKKVVVPAPQPLPVTATVATQTQPPAPAPVESEALVAAQVALQQFRHHHPSREASKLDADLRAHPDEATIKVVNDFLAANAKMTTPPAQTASSKSDLLPAYRAFARGEIDRSVALLTSMIATQPTAEAFLLRGCAKYTAAMLTAKPDLAAATSDFKSALTLNRSLRLDRHVFSPKVVTFFERVKSGTD